MYEAHAHERCATQEEAEARHETKREKRCGEERRSHESKTRRNVQDGNRSELKYEKGKQMGQG